MALLRVNTIQDTSGVNGFSITNTTISINGTLTVSDLVINGTISGSSSYIVPSQAGSGGQFLTTDGSSPSWAALTTRSGIRSMSVFTANGTWTRPDFCKNIMVTCVGAGGGGSGYCEAGGAGGMSQRQVDVTNVSSVSVTVGNPGGGTNYSGCGGNGNTSSFGSYCSASGGTGANCRQQHAGGIGGNGSGGNLNIYGGGGNGHGSYWGFGNHTAGASFIGGTQPSSHNQDNYSHRHQSHAAWGSGGNGAQFGNRGARGREGIVIVQEFFG